MADALDRKPLIKCIKHIYSDPKKHVDTCIILKKFLNVKQNIKELHFLQLNK